MPVAGNFTAVIKIVQHSKLQGQLVLVGRDILAVHSERRISVANFPVANLQIAEDLVVGAILF